MLIVDDRRGVPAPALRSADEIETLDFDLREGFVHHHFFRRGPVVAHLSAASGIAPRVLFAFPAGNTGVGVWFEAVEEPVELGVEGRPIPVMHSDDSFVLLFTTPDAAYLEQAAQRLLRPFPAGLRTPVGIVVANPAFAPCATQRGLFTSDHYHGTVVWSWQQAMLAAGLRRQLARVDLSAPVRATLASAEAALWEVIDGAGAWGNTELWSWALAGAAFEPVPFGAAGGHHDESNAVQLWSTVYLAVKPPTLRV